MFLERGVGEKKRWFYPVSSFIISAGISITFLWTLFYPYIKEQFGLEKVTSIVLASTFIGVGAMIFGPIIAGLIVDKYGPKIPFILSVVSLVTGYLILSKIFSSDSWINAMPLWYTGSFFAGLGQGLYSGTYATVVAKWFPEKPGTATGLGVAGAFVTPIIYPPIIAFMIKTNGFNESVFWLLAIAAVVLLTAAIIYWKSPSHNLISEILENKTQIKVSRTDHTVKEYTLLEAFGDVRFWILFISFLCSSFAFMLFVQNSSLLIIEGLGASIGIEQVRGAVVPLFLTIVGVGGVLGGFIWGYLLDKLGGPWRTLPIIYFSTAVLMFLFYLSYRSIILIMIIGFLLYLGLNGEPTVHYASVSYVFGRKHLGKIMTVLQAFSVGIGIAAGPFLGAYIKDITGGYFWAIMIAVAFRTIATISALIGLKVSKRQQKLKIPDLFK